MEEAKKDTAAKETPVENPEKAVSVEKSETEALESHNAGTGNSTAASGVNPIAKAVAAVKTEPEEQVTCFKCGLDKPLSGCTRKSKKYLCHQCNSAASTLSRAIIGGFDGKMLSELDENAQQEFWRNAAGASKSALATLYHGTVRALKSQSVTDENRGKFMPLAYWQRKGFDIDLIEKNSAPEDIENHPVIGMTYRVHIHGTADVRKKELAEEQQVSGEKDHGVAKPEEVQAKQEPKVKNAKPLTARQILAAEKKQSAANLKNVKPATSLSALLTPVVTKYQAELKKHCASDGPGWDEVLQEFETLSQFLVDARSILAKYGKNPKSDIGAVNCTYPTTKALVKTFQSHIEALIPSQGRKRKAAGS